MKRASEYTLFLPLLESCILRAPDVRRNEARPGIRTTANITTTRRDRCRERPLINRSPPARRRRRRRIAGGLVDTRQPVRPVYCPPNNKYVLRSGAVVGKFDLSRRRTLFELFRAVCFFAETANDGCELQRTRGATGCYDCLIAATAQCI